MTSKRRAGEITENFPRGWAASDEGGVSGRRNKNRPASLGRHASHAQTRAAGANVTARRSATGAHATALLPFVQQTEAQAATRAPTAAPGAEAQASAPTKAAGANVTVRRSAARAHVTALSPFSQQTEAPTAAQAPIATAPGAAAQVRAAQRAQSQAHGVQNAQTHEHQQRRPATGPGSQRAAARAPIATAPSAEAQVRTAQCAQAQAHEVQGAQTHEHQQRRPATRGPGSQEIQGAVLRDPDLSCCWTLRARRAWRAP